MELRQAPGLYITFEGGEASGKTTQIELTSKWLVERGYTPVITREPGGTELGKKLRELILHGPKDMDPRCELSLYLADRAYHVARKVRPALEAGKVVVQDRYFDSSIAYQGAARKLGTAEVRELNLWATQGLIPEITFLLDIEPKLSMRRRQGASDRIEEEPNDFHLKVREQYLQLAAAEPNRFHIIDAGQSIAQVQTEIQRVISTALGKKEAYLSPEKL
ncbi:dTMP kinase [Gleimia sp. 6138-11-ORH1]|uniref:dTMP kinase n=1 Tax=Gleimia sp. 6138-11-ORH1 TaxID=2973937 RepID=UPI00216804DC|nr:dTMP kinase [Gleimia sp. 6138-11-ORH1]MCS4484983.1 dTMP kinase [Gleimia sp. 6138-11-ORH1]